MKIFFKLILILFCTQVYSMGGRHSQDIDKAIDKAIAKYGLRTEPQLVRFFKRSRVQYPPKEVALLAFKQERQIQLWAKDDKSNWRHIHTYPLTAYSGKLGPKLRERDYQIPEGIYRLTSFNPYSSMHLSLMINYPNDFDKLQASREGRKQLGGNIFLHGKTFSVGCLAVGDKAIDQLFTLSRRVGLRNIKLIIAPNDLRTNKAATSTFAQPRWLPELYNKIRTALSHFPIKQRLA